MHDLFSDSSESDEFDVEEYGEEATESLIVHTVPKYVVHL